MVREGAASAADAVVTVSRWPAAPETSMRAPGSMPSAPRAAPISTVPPARTAPVTRPVGSVTGRSMPDTSTDALGPSRSTSSGRSASAASRFARPVEISTLPPRAVAVPSKVNRTSLANLRLARGSASMTAPRSTVRVARYGDVAANDIDTGRRTASSSRRGAPTSRRAASSRTLPPRWSVPKLSCRGAMRPGPMASVSAALIS